MAISFGVIDGDEFLGIVWTGLYEDLSQLKEYVLAMRQAADDGGRRPHAAGAGGADPVRDRGVPG